jgi:Tol biopolymer transport system component
MRFRPTAAALIVGLASIASAQGAVAKRPIRVGDMYRVKNVNDPQLSPDGKWVAYTVTTTDSAKDKSDTDIWMTSWDGSQTIQVTSSPDGESSPRWSPDGRYLAFISSRQAGKGGQLWLLDRRGGEAKRVTELKTGIRQYEWSPDSKRLALVMSDVAPDADTTNKKPKPIVVDRLHFKSDAGGYLDSTHTHIYLFDLETRQTTNLIPGLYD